MGRTGATRGGLHLRAGRKAERPVAHLEHFKGVLHVDGYAGFERLTTRGDVVLAACWAHTRRKFYEVVQTEDTPLAHEALRRIASLYAVEAQVRGQSSAHRLAARRTLAKPIVDALQLWLETHLPHLTGRGKLAEAMRYALARSNGLTRFLYDGRIELDTNPVERAIRPVGRLGARIISSPAAMAGEPVGRRCARSSRPAS
jgi:transposase